MQLPARWDNCELLLRAFNARGVEYLIIGSMARSHYHPLCTVPDMDLLYNNSLGNAKKVHAAIGHVSQQLFSHPIGVDLKKLARPYIQIRIEDVNADILSPRPEFSFRLAFSRSIAIVVVEGLTARIASKHDLEMLDSLRDASERDERPS